MDTTLPHEFKAAARPAPQPQALDYALLVMGLTPGDDIAKPRLLTAAEAEKIRPGCTHMRQMLPRRGLMAFLLRR